MKYLLTAIITSLTVVISYGGDQLVALVNPTAGNETEGAVTFSESGDEITIKANVTGLKADSKHGFHIHEFGDLSADDGTSAGGHYNPEDVDHALPGDEQGHAGDLGNLEADENGVADATMTVPSSQFPEGLKSIVGRAVIIHAKADDGGQPTGNAGPRIAAGVIVYQNPETDPFQLSSSASSEMKEEDAPLVAASEKGEDMPAEEKADTEQSELVAASDNGEDSPQAESAESTVETTESTVESSEAEPSTTSSVSYQREGEVEKAAEKAESAARTTGRVLKNGTEATVETTESVVRKTGKALKNATQQIGRELTD
ncbi:MAG: hypothetical protein CMO55_07340 [Verrucomicrobiales bacterium]|nr:hypothetical protein [Verrucomicrobiales bacterium]